MEFVVNEWLPEYFVYPEGTQEKEKLKQFIQNFYNTKNKLIIKRPSEFWSKLHRFAKEHQGNYEIYNELKTFIKVVLLDSNRVKYIDEQVELPKEVFEKLNQPLTNYLSDQYLFEAALNSDSKIIVTTDGKLIEFMGDSEHYILIHLDKFIETMNSFDIL